MSDLSDERAFPILKTMVGPVRGRVEDGLTVFRGIRYGAPPTGADRFRPSRRPAAWSEPQNAFAYGASAMQMEMGLADSGAPRHLRGALAPILPAPEDKANESEDCLFLNVWSPGFNDGKNRPVMVWLHGGAYAAGSGSWPVYDGAALAKKGDVVVVSINHRLNVFGYLYLGQLAGMEFAQSGNAGMLDIVLALMWVRDHIGFFGGDRANVTLFGESGGGFKVATLMGMLAAKNLYHKAIIQSGPGVRCMSREQATGTAKAILAELGLTLPGDVARLREVPSRAMIDAAAAAQKKLSGSVPSLFLSPVTDGVTVLAHPFDPVASTSCAKVPLLIGHTKDEGTFFLASDPKWGHFAEGDLEARARILARDKADAVLAALRAEKPHGSPSELMADLMTATYMSAGSALIAERKAAQTPPVYAYRFDWETPAAGGALKATHALDIPMVFDTVDKARAFVGEGPAPQAMADKMRDAWIAFARTGNPQTADLPDWPAYDAESRATMLFDRECRVVQDPAGAVRRALNG
jgi:para-nitrobenzyl esterase